MRKKVSFYILLLFSLPMITKQTNIYEANHEIEQLEQTQLQLTPNQQQIVTVGSNFANIVLNALSIIANKEDTQALGNNLSNIMNSFVNIAIEASKGTVNTDSVHEVMTIIKNVCKNLTPEEITQIKTIMNKTLLLT